MDTQQMIATAIDLRKLAELYEQQGKTEQAESLYQRALALCEQVLDPTQPDQSIPICPLAWTCLKHLAELYEQQDKAEQAESLYQRALALCEQAYVPTHSEKAMTLKHLAELYRIQGKAEQAESLYQRALALCEQVLDPTQPDQSIPTPLLVWTCLLALTELCRVQGKAEQAEPLYQRVRAICEQWLGPIHPNTAHSLYTVTELYQRAAAVWPFTQQQAVATAIGLRNLASYYQAQGKDEQAEPLYQRALAIEEEVYIDTFPEKAITLIALAELYQAQGKDEQAEPLYQRALALSEGALGPTRPETSIPPETLALTCLTHLAVLYEQHGQAEQAKALYQRALALGERWGSPEMVNSLQTLAAFYQAQGKDEQAELLYQRALALCEQVFGPTHPTTILMRNNALRLGETKQREATAAAMNTIEKPGCLILWAEKSEVVLQEFLLDKPEMSIGHAPNSDILLPKQRLTSRRHATVRYEDGHYLLCDDRSAIGTLVNGHQLQELVPYLLHDGDQVSIGENELLFRAFSAPE